MEFRNWKSYKFLKVTNNNNNQGNETYPKAIKKFT